MASGALLCRTGLLSGMPPSSTARVAFVRGKTDSRTELAEAKWANDSDEEPGQPILTHRVWDVENSAVPTGETDVS